MGTSPGAKWSPSRSKARRSVPIKELAKYLGHSDPGFTLRVYAHMLPCSHDRARDDGHEKLPRDGQIAARWRP